MKFNELPIEILLKIFSYLAPEGIASASAANKQSRKAIEDAKANTLWHDKFKRHFPRAYETTRHGPNINWYGKFRNAYRNEYRGLSVSVKTLFSLVKESDVKGIADAEIETLWILDRCSDLYGNSLLMIAQSINDKRVLDCLYRKVLENYTRTNSKAKISTLQEYNGKTILWWAISCQQGWDVVNQLLEQGSLLTELYVENSQPIHIAAQVGNLEVVTGIISKDPELINVVDRDLQTPLILAAREDRYAVVDYLISQGANIDAATYTSGNLNHGRTALHWASAKGNSKMVTRLIQAGATTTITQGGGIDQCQAVHLAAKGGKIDAVKALIEADATLLEQMDAMGRTPLVLAVRYRHHGVVDYLLEKKAKVNVGSNKESNETPLYWATTNGDSQMVTRLIQAGANTTIAVGSDQSQVINIAAKDGNLDVVKAFIDKDITLLKQVDNLGLTPLHCAVAKRHMDVVIYLISKGADVNVTTPDNRTPHDFALRENDYEIAYIIRLVNYCSAGFEDFNPYYYIPWHIVDKCYQEFVAGWKALATSKMSATHKKICLETLDPLDEKIKNEISSEKNMEIKFRKIIQHMTLLFFLNQASQQIGKNSEENETFIIKNFLKNDKMDDQYKQPLIAMLHRILVKDDAKTSAKEIHEQYLKKGEQDRVKKNLEECIDKINNLETGYLTKRKNKSGFFFNSKKDYEKRQSSWDHIQELMNGHQDKKVLMRTLDHDIARFSKGYFSNEYSTLLKELKTAINDYGQYERFTFTYKS